MAELEDLPVQESGRDKPLFETVNVLDSRLVVQDSIMFGVEKSGQQITQHIQQASSATSSGCQFSVVVPSLSTVISRKVLIRAQLTFTISCNHATGTCTVLNNALCLAPFAFQQLCSNITCTINNASFTFDCYNQLNEVLRCLDKETLKEFNSYTPTQLDSYANYKTVARTNDGIDPAGNTQFASILDSPFRGTSGVAQNQECYTRGAYPFTLGGNAAGAASPYTSAATVTVNIVEPILMSPFLLSTIKNPNSGGLYGVQNMDFNFQFNNGYLRALRGVFENAPNFQITTISASNVSLEFTYLTPQPSLKLPSRNIVPYMQLQTFKTSISGVADGSPITAISNTIQLPSIPDSVLIGVRKVRRTLTDADAYLPLISSQQNNLLNINFANQPGILSNATIEELYEMSKNSGINMSWLEFSGKSQILATATATDADAGVDDINTCGPLLKLDFGRHINIPQDFYAPGSIGQFTFQVSINVLNNTGEAITDNSGTNPYELVCIFVHSGMIVSSLGTTASYVGLLTKENVVESANKPVINKGQYERIYGGGWFSNLKSGIAKAAKYVKPVARLAKQGLAMSNDPRAQAASRALGMAGAGYSGAGQSAGGKFSNRLY